MKIRAEVENEGGEYRVSVSTNEVRQTLAVPAKAGGKGSGVNGGEFLFLALATCYCNDIYREATREGIDVVSVSVEVAGEFGGPGEPARNVEYHARVTARGASEEAVMGLIERTDQVAEIQNTLRQGADVRLAGKRAVILE